MQLKCGGHSTKKVKETQPAAGILQCCSSLWILPHVLCWSAVVATQHGPCHLQGRPSAQAVGCWLLPADTRSFSRASARGNCGGLLENGMHILELRFPPVSTIHQYHHSSLFYHQCCVISQVHTVVTNSTTRTDFRSSMMLRSVRSYLYTDVSGQPVGPMFKFQAVGK